MVGWLSLDVLMKNSMMSLIRNVEERLKNMGCVEMVGEMELARFCVEPGIIFGACVCARDLRCMLLIGVVDVLMLLGMFVLGSITLKIFDVVKEWLVNQVVDECNKRCKK
jgi:hypothetical protein